MQKSQTTRSLFLKIFLLGFGLILQGAEPSFGQSTSLFNQLVSTSKAEMAKKEGKISIATSIPKRLAVPILKVFRKEFPFIKETTYGRLSRLPPQQALLLEITQGKTPEWDIMTVSSELWPDFRKQGQFVRPPIEYSKIAKSLPADWGKVDERSIDPNGYFLATTGLSRGIAYNRETVPADKAPKNWEDCLDPMWKGKFLYDPRPKLTALWYDPKTREQHVNWLKGIMKNGAVLNRGQTENLQKVAAGEFPLACGVNFHSAMPLIDRGAPLNFLLTDPFTLEFGSQIQVVKWSQTPATTELFALWLASKGQGAVSKYGYRGFPWNPRSKKYAMAKGKYIAICGAECLRKKEEYNKLHLSLLNLPGMR